MSYEASLCGWYIDRGLGGIIGIVRLAGIGICIVGEGVFTVLAEVVFTVLAAAQFSKDQDL